MLRVLDPDLAQTHRGYGWNVAQLSAISADMGTVTAGTISANVVVASSRLTAAVVGAEGDVYVGLTGTNSGTLLTRGNFSAVSVTEGGYIDALNSTGGKICEFNAGSSGLAFFQTTIATRQTVTGSRGGNAALASLLTALSTSGYGLIIDQTTT